MTRFDVTVQNEFDSLPMGITLKDAQNRLRSSPIDQAKTCCLPQRNSFEAEFARAERSGAVKFYLFRNGINWYYCLGFDPDGRLVVTGQGCS